MKFVVISGADACGKDTQIERLETFLNQEGSKTQVLSIQSSLQGLSPAIEPDPTEKVFNEFLLKFEPIARTLFLQSLIKNTLDQIKRNTEIVIFNGYWYKFAASEAAYGVPLTFWSSSAEQYFPKPDIAIHLEVPYETCIQRRLCWTPYERGQARYWGTQNLDFPDYQKRIRTHFRKLFDTISNSVYYLDGNHDEDQVTQNILSLFDESPMPKSTELFL